MLPQTKVTFTTENPKLQRLYDTAVRKALNNLNTFAGDQVLVEGGGYEKIWLETQPMGGEMYAKHNITAALNNHLLFMRTQREDGRQLLLQCRQESYIAENQQSLKSKYTLSH